MPTKKTKKEFTTKPLVLVIIDGWGIAPPSEGNAIALANTPVMDGLQKEYPNAQLCAHGKCVGLTDLQEGNSEAGHMNIGAGRVVDQDTIRITKTIKDGTFFKNPAFLQSIRHVKKNKSTLHIMGLLSNGMSAHSDPDHLKALLEMTRMNNLKNVYLHLFTDGRDSPQHAALKLIKDLTPYLGSNVKIATVMGRYYAMDRKKNWPITEQAYDVLTCDQCTWHKAESVVDAITQSYNHNNTDEFMEPYVIFEKGKRLTHIQDNDSVIFFNLRSDRARQITKAFVQKDFEKMNPGSFHRKNVINNLNYVAMTDFGPDLDSIFTAYPSIDVKETLPMQFRDLRQWYIAETEKYAHVTYFLNGGYADTVAGEKRVIINSPDKKNYEEAPAMSSFKVASTIIKMMKKKSFDFAALNFAAPDMIAHTGNLKATIKACEITDLCIGKIIAQAGADYRVIITADHGNAEGLLNQKTGEIDTQHSIMPVPFILYDSDLKGKKFVLSKQGILGDVAPTILQLMNMKKPSEMTGKSLLKK
ncbi:MAG: 2,3-bisphosphoglycerate-independent phosphoglycerate mutase [bacterium]|nr:2,3-bisphosphoglycerate-independent phosphoglycerate mutase [bacterium]